MKVKDLIVLLAQYDMNADVVMTTADHHIHYLEVDNTDTSLFNFRYNEIAAEPEITPAIVVQPERYQSVGHGANVGPNVTSGKGNWFSGTTWG